MSIPLGFRRQETGIKSMCGPVYHLKKAAATQIWKVKALLKCWSQTRSQSQHTCRKPLIASGKIDLGWIEDNIAQFKLEEKGKQNLLGLSEGSCWFIQQIITEYLIARHRVLCSKMVSFKHIEAYQNTCWLYRFGNTYFLEQRNSV